MQVFLSILKFFPLIVEQWENLKGFFEKMAEIREFKARQNFISEIMKGVDDAKNKHDPRAMHNITTKQ